MIKQALGYGLLEHTNPYHKKTIQSLVDILEPLLTPLLPTRQTIRQKLEKTVTEAVSLANAMACEQAIYHWQMVPVGTVAEETCMEWTDIDQKGFVFLCTFPMCLKEVREEDAQTRVCLVKADVELHHVLENVIGSS